MISDGTRGMENQSLALAKLLNINFELVRYNPPYFLKKFPLIRKLFISSVKDHLLKNKSPPSFIITTGRRMAGVSIALKFILKDKVKNIHIQNPKLPFEYFDLLLIPEHDNITAKNVIQTKGALTFFDFNDFFWGALEHSRGKRCRWLDHSNIVSDRLSDSKGHSSIERIYTHRFEADLTLPSFINSNS